MQRDDVGVLRGGEPMALSCAARAVCCIATARSCCFSLFAPVYGALRHAPHTLSVDPHNVRLCELPRCVSTSLMGCRNGPTNIALQGDETVTRQMFALAFAALLSLGASSQRAILLICAVFSALRRYSTPELPWKSPHGLAFALNPDAPWFSRCAWDVCGAGAASTTARLVNGPNSTTGVLEVLHNGAWGSVCADTASHAVAVVACRQLGFATGNVLLGSGLIGTSTTVWLGNVTCQGSGRRCFPALSW